MGSLILQRQTTSVAVAVLLALLWLLNCNTSLTLALVIKTAPTIRRPSVCNQQHGHWHPFQTLSPPTSAAAATTTTGLPSPSSSNSISSSRRHRRHHSSSQSICLWVQSPSSQPDRGEEAEDDPNPPDSSQESFKNENNKKSTLFNGIDNVQAEANEALQEAERALQEINMDADNTAVESSSSSILIDADAFATTEDGRNETLSILQKLALGKLAAEDVTSKLIEKEKQLSAKKLAKERALQQQRDQKARKEREKYLAIVQKEALASGIGGAFLGLMIGTMLDVYLDSKGIMEVEPIYPPLGLGVGLAVAALKGGGWDEFVVGVGKIVRQVLGGSVVNAWENLTGATIRAVEGAREEVKAAPGRVLDAVDRKVQETKTEIEKIPSRVKESAVERVEEVKKKVESIPGIVKETVVKTAEDTKKGIETASIKAVEEVKATPGRVVEGTKRVVVQTVEDVEDRIDRTIKDTEKKIVDTVERVVAIPTKTFEEISDQVSKILPAESIKVVEEKESVMIPKPPEMPPPPSLLKDISTEEIREVEGKAKVTTPSTPLIPPLTLPKISIPAPPAVMKIQEETSKVVTPVVKGEQQQRRRQKEAEKKDKEDNFVLNEVSLKKFVGQVAEKDKVEETPDSKVQEEDNELAAAVKRKKAAEAKKQALEEAQQRKQALLEEAAERKRLAEERRAEAKRIADEKKLEAERQRLAVVEKKSAEVRLQKAKPGATISLGLFGLGQKKGDDEIDQKVSPSLAPKGIATISKWTQNRDGSISGRISGSSAFTDGESITTSPITTKEPSEQSVVTSISGSRYFLGGKASSMGGFNFLGLVTKDDVSPKIESVSVSTNDQLSKIDALAKARQNAEEKKKAALEAAEARRKQAEERKAAAEAKRREAQEKLQASIAARRDAEAKKQAQKLISSSTGGTISLGALADAKKEVKTAEKLISSARPGATISLGLLGFGQKQESATSQSVTSSTAPNGVPSIRKWTQNRDGSVSGYIYGSPNFNDGEFITTSPIRTKELTEKSVVTTISGSKYFLDAAGQPSLLGGIFGTSSPPSSSGPDRNEAAERRKDEELEKRKAAIEAAEARKKEAEKKRLALKEAAEAKKREADEKRISLLEAKKKRDAELEQQRQVQAKKAVSAVSNAKSRATISLGFLNFGNASDEEKPEAMSTAPPGIPSLSKWKQNPDKSVTGLIYGSRAFKDGESITTSIVKGDVSGNSVVQTVSGSKYYLMSKDSSLLSILSPATKSSSPSAEKSASVLKDAKRGATISLGFLKLGSDDKKDDARATTTSRSKTVPRILQKAPLGIPEISNWRQNRDGSVSGIIYGSKAFKDGESVTTSPITSDAVDGALVQTTSGSKYYLIPKNTVGEKQKAAQAKNMKKAEEVVSEAKPRATISLGFINFGQTDTDNLDSDTIIPSKGKKEEPRKMPSAPRGVPTLYNWRVNRDGSITGFISGSRMYTDGESVTTSPIITDSAYGVLVETASGSKYYLASRGAKLPQPPSPPPPTPSPVGSSRTFSLANPKASPNSSPTSSSSSSAAARTFSLGKPMLKTSSSSSSTLSFSSQKASQAPPGVPKLVKWRKNRDSTITGFITGSSSFGEGDRITTSEIVSGVFESGQVVKTSSGSRYYLV
eukprot:CAMPEP_0176505254 /NCGR_PEP_ID=MMETSP0200_2-20121128/16395_1 /TAXON_ID=947934 /ORGANISM="Chaetoceros sp., Strain GSL56" /LENGTH=1628 /DNA_ID=CAMNT_0017904793 /DNA_START=134 /DNA_END=5020 /DNA_ORIENTATION=+